MGFYILEPCKTRAGFEAIPENKLAWDLGKAEAALAAAGIPTIANAGVILVVDAGCEVSLFESGKLLFKTPNRALAEESMNAVLDVMKVSR
ncbi:MAG: hypothetical protein HY556_06500 [Euryarchaeota archaeon]|nr:hypothetical protein [Euryarchaeota archaeon]